LKKPPRQAVFLLLQTTNTGTTTEDPSKERSQEIINNIAQLSGGKQCVAKGAIVEALASCGVERGDDPRSAAEVLFDEGDRDLSRVNGILEARLAITSLLGQSPDFRV
jgi:hypothetical protein